MVGIHSIPGKSNGLCIARELVMMRRDHQATEELLTELFQHFSN
jgi:hypothetical protein